MNKTQLFSAILISGGLLFQSCGSKESTQKTNPAHGEMATPVSMSSVSEEIITATQSYPATVVALQETEIRAEVTGYITNIYVADGAVVSKGQRMYEIDRTRYQAVVEQANASLAIAKANLLRVEKDLQRYQTLAKQDAIARQTLDYASTDVNNQKAQVQAAEAALITAKTNLERSIITAPFSGIIGISAVRVGALVSAGSTLLNTVSSTNPIAVEFQINEKEIAEFSRLQSNTAGTLIYVTMPDGTRYTEKGHISTIDRAVNSQTGTLKVRASFSNNAHVLRSGMNTTLNVANTSSREALVIPYKAVFEQLGVFNVYTVNDSSKVDLKQVTLGNKVGDKVVVLSGLDKGQKIVLDGAASLRPGAKVVASALNEQK